MKPCPRLKQALDSRAAAYEKLGKLDLALKDARACVAQDGKSPIVSARSTLHSLKLDLGFDIRAIIVPHAF